MIENHSLAQLNHTAAYVAVAKGDGKTARAIINLKEMSRLCETPDPVNLPEIQDVLQHDHGPYQSPLSPGIRSYFGLSCGGRAWRCKTMPMGWSQSPRIAQCAAWGLILEACFRCAIIKTSDADSPWTGPNPPAFLRLPGVFIVIWYDNLLATFDKAEVRDRFFAAVKDVCSEGKDGFNCAWKHLNKHNMTNVGVNSKTENMPKYLGMEFACRVSATRCPCYYTFCVNSLAARCGADSAMD